MDYNLNTRSLREMTGRLVGFTDVDPDVSPGLTRWGRIIDGIFVGGEQWWTIEAVHKNFTSCLIRAKRVHTVMPKAY